MISLEIKEPILMLIFYQSTLEMKEMVLNAWIDERGRVLRQETPLPGLVLEQASSADAISVETIASLKLSKLVEGLQGPSILNLFTSR